MCRSLLLLFFQKLPSITPFFFLKCRSKFAIVTWCLTVSYTSWFYSRSFLRPAIYFCFALPITTSHVFLFLLGASFAVFTLYLYISVSVFAVLRVVCCKQRIEREYLNSRNHKIYLQWPQISWIYFNYIRICKDIENFNYFFSPVFAFLFLASASYAVFQFVVIYFSGVDTIITLVITNTALTLFFMGILSPSMFSGFVCLGKIL